MQIADERGFIECLCSLAVLRRNKGGDDWRDLADQYGDVVEVVVRRSTDSRKGLVDLVIDVAPISISQSLISKAASDLGIWPLGGSREVSSREQLVSDLPIYEELLGRWIKRVQSLFSSDEDFRKEPAIYAVLYRLGQLGGDYGVARAIAKKLVESGDIRRFMRATQLAGEFNVSYRNLDIVWNGEHLLKIIEGVPKDSKRYEKAMNLLRSDEARGYFKRRSTRPTTKWPPEK